MADAPAVVQYGQVIGRFTSFVADGSDGGNTPDEVPLTGTVTLVPSVSNLAWPTTSPPRMAVVQRVVCNLDANGDLTRPDGGPIYIVASSQPSGQPSYVQWTATYSFDGVLQNPSPVLFDVPSSGIVDISIAVPSTPQPSVVTIVSHADAVAAAASAAAAAATASQVPKWIALGQAAYDAIAVKDPTTLYVITGA